MFTKIMFVPLVRNLQFQCLFGAISLAYYCVCYASVIRIIVPGTTLPKTTVTWNTSIIPYFITARWHVKISHSCQRRCIWNLDNFQFPRVICWLWQACNPHIPIIYLTCTTKIVWQKKCWLCEKNCRFFFYRNFFPPGTESAGYVAIGHTFWQWHE